MASRAQGANPGVAVASPVQDEAALPVENRKLLLAGLMLASLLQILDSTIANVAVPHMQSALGATSDSVTWVLTSYMIATAVATPVTGWLSDRLGGRALFIFSVGGFILASVLCGMAQNLEQIVLFRILQGVVGAFIPPLSQSYMLDSTRPSQHTQMQSFWGMVVMVGPILGPFLGGWLTENWNWRFVFYVNLPVGLIALFLLIAHLPRRPSRPRRFDMFGFASLSIALASLQLFLDRGNQVDWFDSAECWIYIGLFLSASWVTIIHFANAREPLIDLALFHNRNFLIAMIFMMALGAIMFATMALLPPLLQRLLGYGVIDTGVALMPRGIGSIISMQLGGQLARRGWDLRMIMAAGVLITSASLWQMSGWSLEVDYAHIMLSGFVQGMGFGMIFIPMNILAFSTLPSSLRTEGSSIFNLFRSVGSSFGVSLSSVALAHNMQVSHSDIASHLTMSSGQGLIDFSSVDRLQVYGEAVMTMLDGEVGRQAAMVAYVDDFHMMFLMSIVVVPAIFLLRKPKPV